MEFKIWCYYLLTELLMAFTPGPAVILVSSQGLKYGTKSSVFGSIGVSSGNLMYFLLSACGVGTLILTTGNLFQYIKLGGAIYLIFAGALMFYRSFNSDAEVTYELEQRQGNTKSFIHGFIAESSNPKAIIFFVALIPMFIDESRNILLQFTLMALTTITIETFVLIFYGWLASNGKRKIMKNKRITKWQDRIAGTTLIGLGLNLIFTKIE